MAVLDYFQVTMVSTHYHFTVTAIDNGLSITSNLSVLSVILRANNLEVLCKMIISNIRLPLYFPKT